MTQVLIDRATLEQLVEATEGLMEWQVKNVKVWHNSAYDTMDMRLNQLRAALANAEPEEVPPLETHCPHGAPVEDYCKLCDMEVSEQFKDTL